MRRLLAGIAGVALLAAGAIVTFLPADAAIDAQQLGGRLSADSSRITFSVASTAATRISVHVYAVPAGAAERFSQVLTRNAGTSKWTATVDVAALRSAGVTGTVYYGFRAWGPNWPFVAGWTPGSAAGFGSDVDAAGNRFNPNKLLLDPYAREVSHDPGPDNTVFASGPHRLRDSGPQAPKGIVLAGSAADLGARPTRAFKDDIVYEVHLRGLTAGDASVPAAERGTYAGAARKAAYLASLGVTAVEFLPVQETINDFNDTDPNSANGDNYWGYLTLNYFAPDRRFAADKSPGGPTREFQRMVAAFHAAGIKVIVDVVYNHTGEGGAWNANDKTTYNVISFRGLDNPSYYSLTADRQNSYDNTGVGGNFNTRNPLAQDLIIDSLAYWRDTLGVDGFRHDLASVLGNTCEHGCFNYNKTDPGTALNRIVRELPARPAGGGTGTDWIAEPWALGDGTYQVGNFPAGWAEWNGQYRDTIRRDQNKLGVDAVTPGQLATRLAGSQDLYGDDGRSAYHSVNFTVAHDGLTHRDLYACNGKNNGQAWPFGPSDGGTNDDLAWDQGGVAADQRRAARTGLGLLLLSAGTPMVTGGDEALRTLRCNNNPYNLDSSANWLGWTRTAEQSTFQTFASRLFAFRKAHPALRPSGFYSAAQVQWFTPAGATPDAAYWNNPDNHALAWRLDGAALGDPAAFLYVAYNGWSGDVTFTLPSPGAGRQWYRVLDTAPWAEGANQFAAPGSETAIGTAPYSLKARSLLLLIAR